MGQITYNTIFSEIQKYMLMMQWAETLIRYLKDKGYAENDEKILSANFIRNTAFTGLLRCKLDYAYNDTKNEIKLMLDNVIYSCPTIEIVKILGKDVYQILENVNPEIVKQAEIELQEKTSLLERVEKTTKTAEPKDIEENKNKKDENIKDTKQYEKAPNEKSKKKNGLAADTIVENIEFPAKESDPKSKEEETTKKPERVNAIYNDNIKENNQKREQNISNKPIIRELSFMNVEQKTKHLNSFVYEKFLIKTKNVERTYIAFPIKIYENENNVPFVLLDISDPNNYKTVPLNDNKMAYFTIEEIEFLAKIIFVNGKFKSIVTEKNGETRAFSISTIDHSYCHSQEVGYGHICFKYQKEYIHIFPLASQNDKTGNAPFIYFITDEMGKVIADPQKYNISEKVLINGKELELLCYWKDQLLISECL